MKTILIINLVVAILNLIMSYLLAKSAKAEFIKLYSVGEFPTTSLAEKIGAIMRLLIIAICPIINFIYLCVYVFAWDTLKEKIIDNLIEMTA